MLLGPAMPAPLAIRALDCSTAAANVSIPAQPRTDHTSSTPSGRPVLTGTAALREVLVPLDGSVVAEHALPWAIEIAAKAGARLRLLHIHLATQRHSRRRPPRKYRTFDRLLRAPME